MGARRREAVAFLALFEPLWRWLPNRFIVLAGANPKDADVRTVDRVYFIGLGWTILLAATVAGVSVSSAAKIAYSLPLPVYLMIGGIWFVMIAGLDRFLVADPKAGFSVPRESNLALICIRWVGHVIVELLKVAPRVAMILVASFIFAEILLLGLAKNEVEDRLTVINLDRRVQFEASVKQEILLRSKKLLDQRKIANTDLDRLLTDGGTNDRVRRRYVKQLENLEKAGRRTYRCGRFRSGAPRYCVTSSYKEAQDRLDKFNKDHPSSNKTIDNLRRQISILNARVGADEQAKEISRQLKIKPPIRTVEQEVREELINNAPKEQSGLFARRRALSEIIHQEAFQCPQRTASTDPQCVDPYDEGTHQLFERLRLFLILFESAPVIMKFVRSILPQGGYARLMSARDTQRAMQADGDAEAARQRLRTRTAILRSEEEVEIGLASTEREIQLRTVSEHRIRRGLQVIDERLKSAETSAASNGKVNSMKSTVTSGNDDHLH